MNEPAREVGQSPDLMAATRMPVMRELAAVEHLLAEQLASHVSLAETIGQHIVGAGGKRLRPLTVLLVAGGCDGSSEQHISLATAMEFLHTATLLHDDVVDHSSRRRGQNTANATWGNSASVLVGDFLYSRSFQLLMNTENLRVLGCVASASAILAEGEVHQLTQIGNQDLNEEEYTRIITDKTGTLFEAAAQSSAILAGADDTQIQHMAQYGRNLGIAFQMTDDVLDYRGTPGRTGKNTGTDLNERKMTLPLIYALRQSSRVDRQLIRAALDGETLGYAGQLRKITAILESCDAIEYTMQQACKHRDLARKALRSMPPSAFQDALKSLAELAVSRSA